MDKLFELGQEVGVVVGGMSLHHLDDFAIAVGGFLRFLAFFVDHAQSVITVVDFWIVGDELMGGLLGFVDSAGFD